MRILVTGGVRSGKSRHAEKLVSGRADVVYIAPGRPADGDDPDWDDRVAAHRTRRPSGWSTIETPDVAETLATIRTPVLVDCLGTWLVAHLDRDGLWDEPSAIVQSAIDQRTDALCAALLAVRDAVVVTNEVGLGVVPSHRSGALFRDLLGSVNQRVAEVCDDVHLVIAGRVLRL